MAISVTLPKWCQNYDQGIENKRYEKCKPIQQVLLEKQTERKQLLSGLFSQKKHKSLNTRRIEEAPGLNNFQFPPHVL